MKIQDVPNETELISEITQTCDIVTIEKNVILAEAGNNMKVIQLVLDGSIMVFN